MIEENLTQADIERLMAENALAAEQLRRIIAERVVAEFKAEKESLQGMQNGKDTIESIKETVSEIKE